LETPKPLDDYPPILNAYAKTINNAITSLQQAIAKLESQEPAALLANAMRFKLSFDSEGKVNCFWNQKELDGRWVALVAAEDDCHLKLTHPPQRTWQGLTDEEIKTICLENGWDSSWQSMRFAHAIEAKLKERNI
jgi:hypothetical protein